MPVPRINVFVAQGDGEVLVASGAAGTDYTFSVDIVVPPRLSPGPARLVARWGTDLSTDQALAVLPDSPVTEPPGTTPVIPFGSVPAPTVAPATPATAGSAPVSSDENGGVDGALVGSAIAVLLIGALGAVWWFRRRRTSSTA